MAKVTIQDIAKELNLSRNTVSKAINNTGILADSTKQLILKKAAEMGYKTFLQEEPQDERKAKGGFVLFTGASLSASHFSTKMLDEIQQEAALLGYGFTIYRIMPQELKECRLPANFDASRTAGIFCVEMFDIPYSNIICSLGIPTVFIDTSVTFGNSRPDTDVLLMENRKGIYAFVKEMQKLGRNDIGFIGEAMHCMSFYERYDAFMGAMRLFGLEVHSEWCLDSNSKGLAYPTHQDYLDYLEMKFKSCTKLPSVFICANDFVAMDVLCVFKKLGIRVPEDIYLCGFDDSPEAGIITPSLTTIQIHARDMGKQAVSLMFSRISNPSLKFRTVYVQTDLIYRASTGNDLEQNSNNKTTGVYNV